MLNFVNKRLEIVFFRKECSSREKDLKSLFYRTSSVTSNLNLNCCNARHLRIKYLMTYSGVKNYLLPS